MPLTHIKARSIDLGTYEKQRMTFTPIEISSEIKILRFWVWVNVIRRHNFFQQRSIFGGNILIFSIFLFCRWDLVLASSMRQKCCFVALCWYMARKDARCLYSDVCGLEFSVNVMIIFLFLFFVCSLVMRKSHICERIQCLPLGSYPGEL